MKFNPNIFIYRDNMVTLTKLTISGMYLVECKIGNNLYDKVRTDTLKAAKEYFKSFKKIAKTN